MSSTFLSRLTMPLLKSETFFWIIKINLPNFFYNTKKKDNKNKAHKKTMKTASQAWGWTSCQTQSGFKPKPGENMRIKIAKMVHPPLPLYKNNKEQRTTSPKMKLRSSVVQTIKGKPLLVGNGNPLPDNWKTADLTTLRSPHWSRSFRIR